MNAILVSLILGPPLLALTFAASAGGGLANPPATFYTRTSAASPVTT